MKRQLISIVTPTYNESENIYELYHRIRKSIEHIKKYEFEIIVIDNCSTDGTIEILKKIALMDPKFRVILNTRNFGHIRSPYYGIMQSRGDATIYLASDLQDPPEYIPEMISEWERGWKVVLATKSISEGSRLTHAIRRLYYRSLNLMSDVKLTNDTTGFGLYDKNILDYLRKINDPYPYLRGLIDELGFPIKKIDFLQPKRQKGISKNNFYSLYDIAILGVISHSKVPIRIASFLGFTIGLLSVISGLLYLSLKLIYWNNFPMGIAPIIIGMFSMFGILIFFIGLIGEYISSIHTYIQNRPIVVESDRINFDDL